jgi:predicted phage gp36 major capsid-like protein
MALHRDSMERPLGTSLKATYRALLARGLEAGEAANLTAFLHGLPSDGFHWTLPEVEAIIRRRLAHTADERLAAATNNLAVPPRDRRRSTIHDRRSARSGSTHVIDPPKP